MSEIRGVDSQATMPRPGWNSRLFTCDLTDPRWLAFVQSQPEATIFHHPAWANLLAESYGYRPFALIQTDVDGSIEAGLPMMEVRSSITGRRFVSLPFTDYCQPLARNAEGLAWLTANLSGWQQSTRARRIEIRGEVLRMAGAYLSPVGVRHLLTLETDSDQVFRRFKRTQVQQPIQKAQRDGVQARISRSPDDLAIFYRLHWQTRQRVGTPVQPKRFMARLWTSLIESGLGFVVLAHNDSQPIAGAVFLTWNRTLIYKYSASDPAHWKLRPNNLVLWTAIQWGCEHGYHLFDFGKTDLDNQGLRDFKSGWGATEVPLIYSYIGDVPLNHTAGLTKRALSKLIQHSPPIVCQTIGELLYGHFA